jgi:hypothetical protein
MMTDEFKKARDEKSEKIFGKLGKVFSAVHYGQAQGFEKGADFGYQFRQKEVDDIQLMAGKLILDYRKKLNLAIEAYEELIDYGDNHLGYNYETDFGFGLVLKEAKETLAKLKESE